MEQKTVFISYRRTLSKHLARSIYQYLKMHDWDVFLDVNTIDSGDFDRIILNQIGARAYFILLISPGSLEQCVNPDDWLLREIQEAIRLERNIVPIVEEGANFNHEMEYLPADMREIVSKKNYLPLTHFYFDAAVDTLRTRFLKTPEYVAITAPPAADHAEVQRRLAEVDAIPPSTPAKPHPVPPAPIAGIRDVSAILPPPFAWIEIPGGQGTLKTNRSNVTLDIPAEPYWISKYPITNAQYAKFVEAGGYTEKHWWTDEGWDWCSTGSYSEPGFWEDAGRNGAECPVVGVSWYEAVAFCLWLSDASGEAIMLPTEAQWQYAAQGDEGRLYPWGNELETNRCNTLEAGIGEITSVHWYENKGDSLFGVVDMVGNVWEWCLTDYHAESNDIDSIVSRRTIRGGSWLKDRYSARAAVRSYLDPSYRVIDNGLRVCAAASAG